MTEICGTAHWPGRGCHLDHSLFCRMVEPLHSFVVMNTLALHLFLQPVTADLEFQDRNPFLLYKSGTGKQLDIDIDWSSGQFFDGFLSYLRNLWNLVHR